MKKFWAFLKRHWRLLTVKEFHSTMTQEEFKKMWNENLEAMRIKD